MPEARAVNESEVQPCRYWVLKVKVAVEVGRAATGDRQHGVTRLGAVNARADPPPFVGVDTVTVWPAPRPLTALRAVGDTDRTR